MTDAALSILERHKATVEAAMDRYFPPAAPQVAGIVEAMRYSLFAGGKRLRPALVLSTAEALGCRPEDVLPAACAVEMVHTYSLIHDDLPCMDDDELRRGIPTNHVKFGEGMAVLAGDALSNAAFWVIAEHTADRRLVAPLVRELAWAAGTEGMIGGQVLDLTSEGLPPDLATVRLIHRMKTAALIRGSLRMGAVAAGADEGTLDAIGEFGQCIGLAFQIQDDVLDEEGDAKTLGKTAGKDREQQKMTYPACIGIERSRQEAEALIERADRLIAPFDRHGHLMTLARFVCSRSS